MEDAKGHGSDSRGAANVAHQAGINKIVSKSEQSGLTKLGIMTLYRSRMGEKGTSVKNSPYLNAADAIHGSDFGFGFAR
jgi:hypothetical protein